MESTWQLVTENGKYVWSNGDCKETSRKFPSSKTNPKFLFIYNNATSKKLKNIHINFWCKSTFSPYILVFFHFSPYILILPLLVLKPINTCYFGHFHQPTNRNC